MPTYNLAFLYGESKWRRFSFGPQGPDTPPPGGGGLMTLARAGSTWAAGFQNAMAISDPSMAANHTPGIIVIGGDTAGTTVSFDGGVKWSALNRGRTNIWHSKIAGLAFDPFVKNRVWAYATNQNTETDSGNFNAGIFWCDLDVAGQTGVWTQKFTNADAPILGVARVGGDNHPRQTGRMVACDPFIQGRAYIATNKGVITVLPNNGFMGFRATDWFTSVCIGPESTASSTVVYATAKDNRKLDGTLVGSATPNPGVTKATFTGTGSAASSVVMVGGAGAPTTPWEVCAVKEGSTTVLYVADGDNGVKKHNGTSWSTIQAPVAGITYKSIDAKRIGTTSTTVIAGHAGGNSNSPAKMIISDDGGATWTLLADANITNIVAGTTTPLWLFNYKPYFKLGVSGASNGYDAARVLIRPDDPNTFFTCGRSGVWRRKIDTGTRKWEPAVQGFGASVALDVKVNHLFPKRIAAGDVDWSVLTADEYFSTPPVLHEPSNHNAHNISWDPNGTGLAAGMGARDLVNGKASGGEVFYNPNPAPFGSGTWENTGLQAAVGGSDFRAIGALVLREAGTRVLIAASASTTAGRGGIWQKVGTGAWRRVANAVQGMPHGGSIRTHLVADAQGNVYIFDPLSGVWRSNNYGYPNSWANIFPITTSTGNRWSNDIAVSTNGDVYVTMATEIWRLNDPQTGALNASGVNVSGGISAKRLSTAAGPVATPGPIDVDDNGWIYVASYASPKGDCGLYRSKTNGDSWENIANAKWKSLALFPVSISVSPSGGEVYAALDGYGYGFAKIAAAA